MTEGSGEAKDIKSDAVDPVFKQFLECASGVDKFITALQLLESSSAKSGNCLVFLKVIDTNAQSPVSFSNASCTVKEHIAGQSKDEVPLFLTMGAFFKTGLEVLKVYAEKRKVPASATHRDALAKLLRFLLLPAEEQLTLVKRNTDSEWQWAMIVTQHLFSKLSLATDHKFDERYVELDPFECPCGHQDSLICAKGDTSFGCVSGWRGQIDILVGDVPVNVHLDTDADTTEDGSASDISADNSHDSSSIGAEVKYGSAVAGYSSHVLSQTITFAFLKKQGLTPLIGIGSSDVVLNFYDSKLDILLRSAPLNFRLGNELDCMVILMLWLALNYQYFCTGVPEGFTKYKSLFHEIVDVSDYQTNTVSPFPADILDNEGFQTDWWKSNRSARDKHGPFRVAEVVTETMKYLKI